MEFTGERVIPWGMPPNKAHVFAEHIARYAWASEYVAKKRVVDLGCGCGYGTYMLSWLALRTVGVDADIATISFAATFFGTSVAYYSVLDLERDDIPSADVYIAFEVLEHLENPAALVRRLDGLLLWSLPIDRVGIAHKHDYGLQDALDLMQGSEFWYQKDVTIVPQDKAWFAPDNALGVLDRTQEGLNK